MTDPKTTSDAPLESKTKPAARANGSADAKASDQGAPGASAGSDKTGSEAGKAGTAKTDAGKTDAAKTDAAKADAGKTGTVKAVKASDAPKPATDAGPDSAGKDKGAATGAATKAANDSGPADTKDPKATNGAAPAKAASAALDDAKTGDTKGSAGASGTASSDMPKFEPFTPMEPEPKQGGTNPLLLVGAAVLGGLIVAFVMRGMSSPGPDEATTERLAGLEARLDGIELGTTDPAVATGIRTEINDLRTRLTGLESLRREVARIGTGGSAGTARGSAAGVAALEGGITELTDAVGQVETRIAQLQGEMTRNQTRLGDRIAAVESTVPVDLDSQMAALTTRIGSLERNDVARDAHRAAMAVALANLTRASRSAGSFAAEVEAVDVLLPNEPLVDALEAYADQGLPSTQVLENRFRGVASDIAKAYRTDENVGVLDKLWSNVLATVTVRPTGDIQGNSVLAILARAETRLAEDNLQGSVAELRKLDGPAAEAASDWMALAQARLQLDRLIGELNTRVIAGISADTAPVVRPAPAAAQPQTVQPEASQTAPATDPVEAPASDAPAAPDATPGAAPAPADDAAPAPEAGAADESAADESAADADASSGDGENAGDAAPASGQDDGDDLPVPSSDAGAAPTGASSSI